MPPGEHRLKACATRRTQAESLCHQAALEIPCDRTPVGEPTRSMKNGQMPDLHELGAVAALSAATCLRPTTRGCKQMQPRHPDHRRRTHTIYAKRARARGVGGRQNDCTKMASKKRGPSIYTLAARLERYSQNRGSLCGRELRFKQGNIRIKKHGAIKPGLAD